MITADFHVHSSFSDGANSPEEIVAAALAMGMTHLGFADHGYAPYDADCCMPAERVEPYRAEIARLKENYRGTLAVFCGVEQDIFSGAPGAGFDYVIGSVHYVCADGVYYAIDDTPEKLADAVQTAFGGDPYALIEEYYRTVSRVAERTACDIIGHFDLISKFSEKRPWFDPAHPRYIAAWRGAAEALLQTGLPFEINTGAMSRRWRTQPYPARDILVYLRSRGARFVLSSDSHSAGTLCWDFARQEADSAALGLELVRFSPQRKTE